MKIIIDDSIPFIKGVFEAYADVAYLPGSTITRESVTDADCLIIRTRTKCNESLLKGTHVKMIASASFGTDHIDRDYCQKNGIYVQSVAGSNTLAVMNYVFSAIYGVAARKSVDLSNSTIGIMGGGNGGSKIEQMARELGFNVLICDPPKALEGGEASRQYCSQDYLLENSDIVTMHVPLNENTRRMCGEAFFDKMKFGAFFINASRGSLVDEAALISARGKLGAIIIDTWDHEPDVNRDLVEICDIATPHIAGYSYPGKMNSTMMAVRSTARFFELTPLYDFFPVPDKTGMDSVRVDVCNLSQGQIASIFQYNYPIFTDDFMFRMDPSRYEEIRSNYPFRREFYID